VGWKTDLTGATKNKKKTKRDTRVKRQQKRKKGYKDNKGRNKTRRTKTSNGNAGMGGRVHNGSKKGGKDPITSQGKNIKGQRAILVTPTVSPGKDT